MALFAFATFAWGNELKVPQQFPTIQSAVDAAGPGDTVLIAKGTYRGPGNVNIDTHGKAMRIEGAGYLGTIIDCQWSARGFIFQNAETSATEVRSLTVQKAKAGLGGAILVDGASPAILYCSFNDCRADFGAAAAVEGGNPGFVGCQFVHNHSAQGGGAIFSEAGSCTLSGNMFDGNSTDGSGGAVGMRGGSLFIVSCFFKENMAEQGGGAFYSQGGDVAFVNGSFSVNTSAVLAGAIELTQSTHGSMTNCTFAANKSRGGVGGIHTDDSSRAVISNSILWMDGTEFSGHTTIRYSCIQGGANGEGNTSEDPKIANALKHDLHILIGSPCIDRADRNAIVISQDQDGRNRIIGGAPDIGAYEFPIVRPAPIVTADADNVFQVPHDGNPDTDTVVATVHGSAFDWLHGTLAYLWTCDDKVLGTNPDLTIPLEPGEKEFNLQVRDDTNDVTNQKVHVTVLAEKNSRPVSNAGPDQVYVSQGMPVHVTLHGTGYDADGDPLTYSWSPIGSASQTVELDLSPGNYYYTLTVTDPYGASSSSVVHIHVSDGLGPKVVINGDDPYYLEVFSPWIDPGASATDDVDGKDLVVTIYGTVDNKHLGRYHLVYAATDSSGNTGSNTRDVIVRDTTPPVITLNGANPMTVPCTQGYTEPGATAHDNYDGDIPVNITGSTTSTPGTYTITYTATDSSGNTTTATRTVIVADPDGPVITLKGDNPMTVECGTGYVEPGATATDACIGASLPVTITGTVPTTSGTYTVTYTATGSSGVTATKTRTVIVSDSKAPIITLKGSNPMTVECGYGYAEPGATATDACDGSNIAVTITGSVGAAKGTYVLTYTAKDKAGNTATVTRTVNITDTTPPTITLNGSNPMNVECGSGYVEPGASAIDSCDGLNIPVVITGSVQSTKGTYIVTYTAADSSGNKTTATRTVKVVDTTAPVITITGANPMTVQCGSGYVEYGAMANDVCDGNITVITSGLVPSAVGTYTVTYTATDSSGNSASSTRTVNVIDTIAPVITLNGSNPMTADCQQGYTEPGATAVDACDGSVAVTITGTVPAAVGTYTVTYTARDSHGNTATTTRTVTMTTKTPPSANSFNATPTSIKGGKTSNVNLHYGFNNHCAAITWHVECVASGPAGSVITKIDDNNFTIKAVTGCTYTFTLYMTDAVGNTSTATCIVNGT